jgi:hypothetical protein
VVIFDTVAEEKVTTFFGCFPPGCDGAPWRLAAEFGQHFVRLVENVALLFERHIHGVFVRVTMETNLVAGISNSSAVFGKSFERMT